MRLVELLMSIPGLYLLLALRSAFMRPEPSPVQVYTIIVVILSVIGWAGTARIIRGMTLSLRKRSLFRQRKFRGSSVEDFDSTYSAQHRQLFISRGNALHSRIHFGGGSPVFLGLGHF